MYSVMRRGASDSAHPAPAAGVAVSMGLGHRCLAGVPVAVVLRRLDCVLKPTKASGHAFRNTSRFDFESLLDDAQNIGRNLVADISGFSENVRDIVEKFGLRHNLELLDQKNLLFLMVQKTASPRAALDPDVVSNHDMGYVFEELTRRFNEQANENPGEHFTPLEAVRLMVRLVLNGDRDLISRAERAAILAMLATMPDTLYRSRNELENALRKATKDAGLKLAAPVKKALLSALSERGEAAGTCTDAWINDDRKGRDDKDKEVGILGYEIDLNRNFCRYEPPAPLAEIDCEAGPVAQGRWCRGCRTAPRTANRAIGVPRRRPRGRRFRPIASVGPLADFPRATPNPNRRKEDDCGLRGTAWERQSPDWRLPAPAPRFPVPHVAGNGRMRPGRA